MTEQQVDSSSELPPAIPDAIVTDLSVTVHSIEGLKFLTELGNQQLAVSVLFPTHMNDSMSPLLPPSDKISWEFTERYNISFYQHSTVNVLLANPLEFYLYVCQPDMKKPPIQIARFVFPFDQLLFNNSYSCQVEGRVLPEGANVLESEGIKANVEFSWSVPLWPQEVANEAIIVTFNIQSINATPVAMNNCSTQPNNSGTHIFTYDMFAELPDNQTLLCEEGKFTATTADFSDASVVFNTTRKFFVKPDELAKWKDAAEQGQNISLYVRPTLNPLLQPLGITPDQYSALNAEIQIPLAHFAKPGRSHFLSQVPLTRDMAYNEHVPGDPLMSPSGFPPEPAPEAMGKGKKLPARKGTPSARTAAPGTAKGKASATPGKKAKALSAKDKKMLSQMQNILNFDPTTDYFKESTTQLKLEISLSKPIIPRPATPASSKSPEEIVPPLPKMHMVRLANATEEYCRQLNIAIDRLKEAVDKKAVLADLKKGLKEELKPSIVEIVKQVFMSKKREGAEITESFMAELRSFLVANLHKTMNTRFDLSYPRAPPVPPGMSVEHITNRLKMQMYHHTDDIEALHIKRCELDPLNSQWPFELALYYNDQKSPKALEWFAKAISIDYGFTAAILGFCAQLAKSGNREDAIVLLNLLETRKADDPTVTVCLSILYQLIESSKTDEFMAKISRMTNSSDKSPNIVAAGSLLDVHDTCLSEIVLTREQLQSVRSTELLVLLARFTQQNGEYSRAQEYLREAIEGCREDFGLWKMLGEFQYAAGEYDKALTSLEQLLALCEETDPDVCLMLAIVYIRNGKYEKAYDLLMFTIQKVESALAWACLGVCCLRLNDLEEADACFCQSNEFDKWNATTWGYCAVLCAKMNKWVEGEQALCWASRLQLRDYRLIHEILLLYSGHVRGEETKNHVHKLQEIQKEDCHRSLESDDPSKNTEEEEQVNEMLE